MTDEDSILELAYGAGIKGTIFAVLDATIVFFCAVITLPCPFCGSKAQTVPLGVGAAIRCQNCAAQMSSPLGRERAQAAWNRRF